MDHFAKLVSGRMKARAGEPHPNPDLLAAFAENALPGKARGQLIEHLGTCSECRDVLYLALPDSADAQKVLSLRPNPRPRFALRWGTLAASVAIVAVVFTAYKERRTVTSPAAPAPAQVAAEKPPAELDKMRAADAISEPRRDEPKTLAKERPPAKHMTASPKANLDFDSSGQVRVRSVPASEIPAQDGSAGKDKPAAPANSISPQQIASRAKTDYKSANDSVEVSASNAPVAAEQQKVELDRRAYATSTPAQLVQWTISPQGSVQRSHDSGKTWQNISVSRGTVFRALSAVGANVWAGGNGGKLYHSADSGQNWVRVEAAAAGKKLQADIVRVDFPDPLHGTLTASNGEVWSTSDGGQTWRLE